MTDVYSSNQDVNGAFEFSEQGLRAIFQACTRFLGEPPKASITFLDDQEISSSDLDALLADPLVMSRRIEAISFVGYTSSQSGRPARNLTVRIRAVRYGAPVTVKLSADREAVQVVRQNLGDLLAGARTWLSPLAMHYGTAVSVSLQAVVSLSFMMALTAAMSQFHVAVADYVGALVAFGMIFALAISWLRRRVFPPVTFSFGKSGQRSAALSRVRVSVMAFVVITLLGGLLVNYLSQWLPQRQ